MIGDELLEEIKNYLDITWDDSTTDEKVAGIAARGMAYLDNVASVEQDYTVPGAAQSLLLDYCRYAYAGVSEMFAENYKSELIMLRAEVQASDYNETCGE